MSELGTKFENALIELIELHMDDGLSGKEVREVLVARMDDDFDAGHMELTVIKEMDALGLRQGKALGKPSKAAGTR